MNNNVYLVATGQVYEGEETYTRHETAPPPLCDCERLLNPRELYAERQRCAELVKLLTRFHVDQELGSRLTASIMAQGKSV